MPNTSKEDRNEYRRLKLSGTLAAECGTACVNCESTENIEYHHIVPLILGGTNNLRNIVPLCHRCHKAAHCGGHISNYTDQSKGGRKPKIPDEEAFPIYDQWLEGKFGNIKCQELLNLGKGTHCHKTAQFKRWCKSRGIADVKHRLDYAVVTRYSGSGDFFSDPVGYVIYDEEHGGRREDIYFQDSGMNNNVKYMPKGYDREVTFQKLKIRLLEKRYGKKVVWA